MAYTASQNPKTGTTYTAAALFATLILFAGIAALAMRPAEAFAKPLCNGNGAGVRKLAVNPFDPVYTNDAERDIVFIEAPIHQRTAW